MLDDRTDRSDTGALCLVDDLLDDKSLSLCTLGVVTGCITDSRIGDRLNPCKIVFCCLLALIILERSVIHTRDLGSLNTVVIEVADFLLRQNNGDSAEVIHKRRQRLHINDDILRNIEVEVGVQHGEELMHAAVRISRVALIEVPPAVLGIHVEVSISVEGYHTDSPCVIVHARDEHRV